MKLKLQFAGCFLALGGGVIVVPACYAQRERANWAQNRQGDKPPKQERQQQRQDQRREQTQGKRQERKEKQEEVRRDQDERGPKESGRRPAGHKPHMPRGKTRPNNNTNRP